MRDVKIFLDNETGQYVGEVHLVDKKTSNQSRSVPLTDSLCRELLVIGKNKTPDDAVFSMEYGQLDYPWRKVRDQAGLGDIRFKDLRAQTAIYGEEAGIP